ncbi:interferon alpha/beta receptor 2-like isoform X2 [Corvus hawaiiensis]|uniref:interferon alpha/beta receptor 2-like isoform X2 n=1 Tax=Corvus hawaiiensis TaxID=134902 RepID=UPI002018AB60|nr:interferon alpha/beta receptor 2-like isoform X2 [Corvus hawaiiensis]
MFPLAVELPLAQVQKQNVSSASRGVYLLISTGALMAVPMLLSPLVYLIFLSTAVCSQPERKKGLPYNLQMDSHNFRHILSWQTEHDPAVPASYNVLYKDHRSSNWLSAKQCSGISQLSCELTEEFKERSSVYCAQVQSIRGTQVLNSSVLHFVPSAQTILGPPEVNITSCPNCINVTIKLPTSHLREKGKLLSLIDIYEELDYNITLKSLDGEHKRPRQKTTKEVFSTVIGDLYPSRNYCVSVEVRASLNRYSIPSSWKCVSTDLAARQGYREGAVAGAVCFALIIAAVLMCAHAAGFTLLKVSLPPTLACIRKLAYSPWVFESENLSSLEIIPREVKSKARGCRGSASDDSDSSDSDSSALCDHDYARRAGLGRGRVRQGCDSPGTLVQYSVNSTCEYSGSQAGDTPAAEPELEEHEGDPEGDTDTRSELLSPFSEGSGSSQGNSECFTINLHTVLLGTLEPDGDSSAAAPSSQEDADDWHCAHALEAKLLEDTGSVQEAPCSNDFHEWQNSSSSEDSGSLDSDTEHVTGYMRR